MPRSERHSIEDTILPNTGLLPEGTVGVDAGMTLTKVAQASQGRLMFEARETRTRVDEDFRLQFEREPRGPVGVTGARLARLRDGGGLVKVQEIEAAARGTRALLRFDDRDDDQFLLVLMGTGTACAAVRGETVSHLGGTAMGGGSFAGIARAIDQGLTYEQMIAGAERGDRCQVDILISDIYPEGIGSVGPNMTASHLARSLECSIDDFLAGLMHLHGENIAQIMAARARVVGLSRLVVVGGFAHNNHSLIDSMSALVSMLGLSLEVPRWPGYAGALGAALVAAEPQKETV